MENFFYKKLIVYLFALGFFLTLPSAVFAQKEAGSSATITLPISSSNVHEMNLKRAVLIDMFTRYHSPFITEVDAFLDTCQKYQIDCYLLPSIAGLESSFGKFTHPESHNPFGWGGGYIMFDSWASCFDAVGKGIRENYINKWHVDTIETMGPIYAESPTWAQRVRYFHDQFEKAEAEKALYFSNLAVEW